MRKQRDDLFSKMKKKAKTTGDVGLLNKRTASEKIVFAIIFTVFMIYAISIIYPLIYLIINSLQDAEQYLDNISLGGNAFALPEVWHFENYTKAFSGFSMINFKGEEIYLYNMLINSIWYCLTSVFCGLMMSAFTSYVLSKYVFRGRSIIYALAIFSMTIPIVGTMGSMFKLTYDLQIYNTPLFVILTSLGGLGFNFLVMYGFFESLSWSYAEACFIDGGGHFTTFFRIMLPQVIMPMVTLGIIAFITAWNDYQTPLLYMPDYPTLASGIYSIKMTFKRSGDTPSYFAGLVISTIPVVILYSCCSGLIMKNFTVGGLKG
jgi:ABC-type glycerol-3-phosphate transport system permease component